MISDLKVEESPSRAAADDRDLTVEVSRELASSEEERARWDEATAELDGSVYMTHDWVRTWWRFYGGGRALRIFRCEVAGRSVGIVPVYIEEVGFGPVRCRVARLVGANVPPKVFNPPVDPAWGTKILRAICAQLFEKDGCDVVSLGPISEAHPLLEVWESACRGGSIGLGGFRASAGVHSVFHLPDSMDSYFSALSRNERKNRRKYELRTLKKEHGTRVEVLSEPARVAAEFERFADQHARQWKLQGKPGHFGAWPGALEFNRALVEAQGRCGRVRFLRIVADEQVIASQYAFAFGERYYWELPARVVGPEWERFSLGPTGIVQMIAAAIQEGKREVEGGLAHYDYKLRLNATEYAVKTLRLVANRRQSRMRARMFEWIHSCTRVGYHKIWYQRIAPRLPACFPRSQWKTWLRLDF